MSESFNFYAEDLGVSLQQAVKIDRFISLCRKSDAITSVSPWVKGDMIRVYVEFWTQNSRGVFDTNYDKFYYDVIQNDFFVFGYAYGSPIRATGNDVLKWKSGAFSGAKTRQRVKDFLEVFYNEKSDWD